MKLVFLDIDGVLNGERWYKFLYRHKLPRDNEHMLLDSRSMLLLSKLVQQTKAEIVISSTWRVSEESMNNVYNQFANYGLRFIDRTPRIQGAIRGKEIQQLLDDYKFYNINVENFVIIDDDADMGDLLNHLAKTSWKTGLDNDSYNKALAILNGQEVCDD